MKMKRHATLSLSVVLLLLVAASPAKPAPDDDPGTQSPSPLQQLFLLKKMKPGTKKVGIIWKKGSANHAALMPDIKRGSASTGIKAVVSYVQSPADVGPALRALVSQHNVDVLWVVENDGLVNKPAARSFLIEKSLKKGIPLMAPTADWVSAGATLSFKNGASGIVVVVNKAAAKAFSITVPAKYQSTAQFVSVR